MGGGEILIAFFFRIPFFFRMPFFFRTYPAAPFPLFAYHLPCRALNFLRTYPAVHLIFFCMPFFFACPLFLCMPFLFACPSFFRMPFFFACPFFGRRYLHTPSHYLHTLVPL